MARGASIDPRRGIVISAVAAACSACSGFDGAGDRLPETSSSAQQVSEGGFASNTSVSTAAADLSCLNDPPASSPNVPATEMVSYSLPVRSLFGAPLENLVARVCLPADPMCSTPISIVKGLTPNGLLVIQVPAGFNGFLEVLADGHVPVVFYMRRPVVRDTVDELPLSPIPTAGVPQIAALFNAEVLPELGLIAALVVDCRWNSVAGATISNNLGGRTFYFANGLPSGAALATDSDGIGGFINVPIRPMELSGQLAADGRVIGTRTIVPRPGWLMAVLLRPASLPVD